MPTLVVQKGHCYRTTGATGTAGEQAFATSVADACVALLNGRNGWTVRVILADDPSGSYHGDAFAAIHGDGSLNTSVRGASVGYRTPEGQEFGQAWKRAYAARGWSGGFRPDNYTVALAQYYGTGTAVSQGNRRAVIVECGFLTSPEDRALLTGPGGPERVAQALGDALGITSAPLPPSPPPPAIIEEEPVLAFITCSSPNQSAALLPGGAVVNITSDIAARQSAQSLIDAKRVVEWHVSNATFQALLATGVK